MALSPGMRLGPSEILAPLGAGGMGACGARRASVRVETPSRGGGAPRHFLKWNDLAHAGATPWR
jgi:hypothetical protein